MLIEQNVYEDQKGDEVRDPVKSILQSSLCCLSNNQDVELYENGEKFESKHNKIVHFLQIDTIAKQTEEGLRPDIDLRSLGTKGRKIECLMTSESPMTDIKSINVETEEDGGQKYNQTVILRRDGTAEFYYNFSLVDWTGNWTFKADLKFISKIECNFKQFVLQFTHPDSDPSDPKTRKENYKIELSNRNRIG